MVTAPHRAGSLRRVHRPVHGAAARVPAGDANAAADPEAGDVQHAAAAAVHRRRDLQLPAHLGPILDRHDGLRAQARRATGAARQICAFI